MCCLLAALVGPVIVSLAPIWFLGYVLYHGLPRLRLSRKIALTLAAGGLLLLFLAPRVREAIHTLLLGERNIVASYYDAFSFALYLAGITSLSPPCSRCSHRMRA